MSEREHDLSDPAAFYAVAKELSNRDAVEVTGIDCPTCGDRRRVDFKHVYSAWKNQTAIPPLLASLRCRQCATIGHGFLFEGPDGMDLMLAWPTQGGLRTPSTPTPVAYYLDQAGRSECAGARSAAVAMYRAALEQLLFEQGYTAGMLATKIGVLEGEVKAGTAKKWATELHPDFLKVIKDLGNGSIHPNGGDISKQDAFDSELLSHVRETMRELLDLVYEEPGRRATRLAKLKSKAAVVK